MILGGKKLELVVCVLIFSSILSGNISHSEKN
jgi:hypothetical protein